MNMTTTDVTQMPTEFTKDFPACPVCLSPTKTNGKPGYFYENRASCSRQCLTLENDNVIRFEPEDDGLAIFYFPARSIAEVRTISYPRKTIETIALSYSDFQEKVLTYKPITVTSRLGKYFSRPLSIEGMTLSEVIKNILNSY